jgi:hypothetical protein
MMEQVEAISSGPVRAVLAKGGDGRLEPERDSRKVLRNEQRVEGNRHGVEINLLSNR